MPRKKAKIPDLGAIIISILVFVVFIFLLLYGLSNAKFLASCLLGASCQYSLYETVVIYGMVILFAAWLLWQLKKSGLIKF